MIGRLSLALPDIAERMLDRLAGYSGFADFIGGSSTVLGFGLCQARGLIAAARFMRDFPCDVARPSRERQMRPLVGCHPDVQLKALALERRRGWGVRVSMVVWYRHV
jgi:hypothetical protein